MLIEQAFFILPEVLLGARYPLLDYETSIVGAFTMSLLQELNGRNANNPLSHLSMEHPYGVIQKSDDGDDDSRALRADLRVWLGALRTGTKLLSAYGLRYSNWIEAKYFRKTFDGTKNVGLLLADLIRLATLPPLETKRDEHGQPIPPISKRSGFFERQETITGRYLLHVYNGRPSDYVSMDRNQDGGRVRRTWLERIQKQGPQRLIINDLDKEPKQVRKHIGNGLAGLKLVMDVTNFAIQPLGLRDLRAAYSCLLTRIDGFRVLHNQCVSISRPNRRTLERPKGAHNTIRAFVASKIALKDADKRPPKDSGDDDVNPGQLNPPGLVEPVEVQAPQPAP